MKRFSLFFVLTFISVLSFAQNPNLEFKSDYFGFYSDFQFVTDTAQTDSIQSLWIHNTGDDDLIISQLSGLSSPFSFDLVTPDTIKKFDSLKVDIILNRQVEHGYFRDTLEIMNNDLDTGLIVKAKVTKKINYSMDSVDYWIGSGSNEAALVIDFNNDSSSEAFIWGYRFDGQVTAEDMLKDIDSVDNLLTVNMAGGYLNDIFYDFNGDQVNDFEGEGGNPYYWSLYSGKLGQLWSQNSGLSTTIEAGDYLGASYSESDAEFFTINDPEKPVDASSPVIDLQSSHFGYYTDFRFITDTSQNDTVQSIWVYNQGVNDLTISELSGLEGSFSINQSLPISISQADSLELKIHFDRNLAHGYYRDTLDIINNNENKSIIVKAKVTRKINYPMDSVDYWIGSGSKEAALVIDFNNDSSSEAFIWGYRFDGQVTAEDMLQDIDSVDNLLTVNMAGGYLNDIFYDFNGDQINDFEGEAGSPYYWSLYSGKLGQLWSQNSGLSTTIEAGDYLGASYAAGDAEFFTINDPEKPVDADKSSSTGIEEMIETEEETQLTFYPVPFYQTLNIKTNADIEQFKLLNIMGQVIYKTSILNSNTVHLSEIPAGKYIAVVLTTNGDIITRAIVKQ